MNSLLWFNQPMFSRLKNAIRALEHEHDQTIRAVHKTHLHHLIVALTATLELNESQSEMLMQLIKAVRP
ncbi:hypothetical protein M2401_003699 [Pseudomonas sp. JUb42]|nr:hypothetical protein [Pseudomonas sp. JUb42]